MLGDKLLLLNQNLMEKLTHKMKTYAEREAEVKRERNNSRNRNRLLRNNSRSLTHETQE
jgi:hypothetical protein